MRSASVAARVERRPVLPFRFDVLAIEDDPEYRTLIRRWLETSSSPSFRLRFASRLDEAWHRLGRCDLLLLDLGLPDSSGLDTLVAARDLARSVPIVVMTALDASALAPRVYEAGADAFVAKTGACAGSLRDAVCDALAASRAS